MTNEDLRQWFKKGGTGGTTKGGWDRYSSTGKKLGKCGGGKEGENTMQLVYLQKEKNLEKKV